MIKLIIFDYGGVVAGSQSEEHGLYGLCEKFSKILNLPVNKVYSHYHKHWKSWKLGKVKMQKVYSEFLKELNSESYKDELIRLTLEYATLNKKVVSLIHKLKKKYKVVCLTNHAREWFSHDAERFNLDKLFDKIYTSYELGIDKPSKQAYFAVTKSQRVKPEECLFIDDLARNVYAANAYGFNAIHFKSATQLKHELKKLSVI